MIVPCRYDDYQSSWRVLSTCAIWHGHGGHAHQKIKNSNFKSKVSGNNLYVFIITPLLSAGIFALAFQDLAIKLNLISNTRHHQKCGEYLVKISIGIVFSIVRAFTGTNKYLYRYFITHFTIVLVFELKTRCGHLLRRSCV